MNDYQEMYYRMAMNEDLSIEQALENYVLGTNGRFDEGMKLRALLKATGFKKVPRIQLFGTVEEIKQSNLAIFAAKHIK